MDNSRIINKKQEWGLPGIYIPAEVLFNPELTNTEKILFGFIKILSASEDGCFASNAWLAEKLEVKNQTITNSVSNLLKLKYITVITQKNKFNFDVRHIFVNPKYPMIYDSMIKERYKKLNKGVLNKSNPPIKTIIEANNNINTIYNKTNIIDLDIATSPISSLINNHVNGYITIDLFDKFWQRYPKKVNKGTAKSAWIKLCNKKDKPLWRDIRLALSEHIDSEQWKDPQYIANPSSWLNGYKWMNDAKGMKRVIDFDKQKEEILHKPKKDYMGRTYTWNEEYQDWFNKDMVPYQTGSY